MKNMCLLIIAIHFAIDWLAQTRWEAENKSRRLIVLARHLSVNFLAFVWLPIVWPTIPLWAPLVNTATHGLIDWNIWRAYKRLRRNEGPEFMERNLYARDYWFYATIAVDQTLHLMIAVWLFT